MYGSSFGQQMLFIRDFFGAEVAAHLTKLTNFTNRNLTVVTLKHKLSNGMMFGGLYRKIFLLKIDKNPLIRCKLHVRHGVANTLLISNGVFAPTAQISF